MLRQVARTCFAIMVSAAVGLCASAFDAANHSVSAKESIYVTVDRAKVMRINAPADTVIVGNPAIADAVMHDPSTLVIVGRRNGTTNLIVLDREGKPLADEVIVVRAAESTVVTVQRQSSRYSYSCAPNCAPAPAPGDQKDFFDDNSTQSDKINKNAQEAAKGTN